MVAWVVSGVGGAIVMLTSEETRRAAPIWLPLAVNGFAVGKFVWVLKSFDEHVHSRIPKTEGRPSVPVKIR
jgi:hypothetical protein